MDITVAIDQPIGHAIHIPDVPKPVPDSQITGRIVVEVQDYPVHVTVQKFTPEGTPTYYDMNLSPAEDADITAYVLLVDYCECPQNPSEFPHTYTSPSLTCIYNSVYHACPFNCSSMRSARLFRISCGVPVIVTPEAFSCPPPPKYPAILLTSTSFPERRLTLNTF